jgi:hypothetical protein
LSNYTYRCVEQCNPDLSGSEIIEQDDELEGHAPGGHSEPSDAGTPGSGADGDESDEDGEEGEADDDIDEELAAEFDRELEGEDEDEDDEEDEDEDDETRMRRLPISSSRCARRKQRSPVRAIR